MVVCLGRERVVLLSAAAGNPGGISRELAFLAVDQGPAAQRAAAALWIRLSSCRRHQSGSGAWRLAQARGCFVRSARFHALDAVDRAHSVRDSFVRYRHEHEGIRDRLRRGLADSAQHD